MLKTAGQGSLSLPLYTSAVLAGMNETATLFAEQASAAGVNVSVVRDDPATYYSTGSPGGAWPNKHFSIEQLGNWPGVAATVLPIGSISQCPVQRNALAQRSRATSSWTTRWLKATPTAAEQKWHDVQKLQFDEGGYIVTTALNNVDGYSTKIEAFRPPKRGPAITGTSRLRG